MAGESLNWKAAAEAAAARRAELGLTQEKVIERMGAEAINIDAYRKFEGTKQRTYQRRTLAAIDRALGWEPNTLWSIAAGAPRPAGETVSQLRGDLANLTATVEEIAEHVAQLQRAVAELVPDPAPRKRRGQ